MKNTSSFSFFSFSVFRSLECGKIYANFSGEIVTSSSVVDHCGGGKIIRMTRYEIFKSAVSLSMLPLDEVTVYKKEELILIMGN